MNAVIIILMLAVVVVLAAGFVLMFKGGDLNRKYGNKLMIARVCLQALVIALLLLMFMMSKS